MEKKKKINVDLDLDKALGQGHRKAYLEQNPHGFTKVNKVHKDKSKYSRKKKHKKSYL